MKPSYLSIHYLLLFMKAFSCFFFFFWWTFPQVLLINLAVLDQVLDMINDPHYLYRMTILHAISLLAPVMGSEVTCSKLLPVIVETAKDRSVFKFSFLVRDSTHFPVNLLRSDHISGFQISSSMLQRCCSLLFQ